MDESTLLEFFKICTLINLVMLVFASLMITFFQDWITSIHHRMTGIEKQKLIQLYLSYIAIYKLLVIVFNITPFIALTFINKLS